MNGIDISDDVIISDAKKTLLNARKFVPAFSNFGMDEHYFKQFESKIKVTEKILNNRFLRLELKELTQKKNEALDACYKWGRQLRARLKLAFGKSSPIVKSFPVNDFITAANNEIQMITIMDKLIKIALNYRTELIPYGQTQSVLIEGTIALNKLRTTDATHEQKISEKKFNALEKSRKLKDLYETVNRIKTIGKQIFKNDPAKSIFF